MNKSFLVISLITLLCFEVIAESVGQPGEIFPVMVENKSTDNHMGLVEINGNFYKQVPLSFSKQGKYIVFNDTRIFIQAQDFGESRITITNDSLVNLNDQDRERTIKESAMIQKALKSYSKDMLSSFNFINPVEGIISSRYGKKRFINGSPRSPHLALDIAAPEGTKIISPENGKVILVGDFFYSGKYVIIDHGHGLLSSYSHMSKVSVSKNDIVMKGQKIGEVGSTGRVTGPHLHWTVYYENVRINPESLLKENYLESLL